MARTEARFRSSAWTDDDDFRALHPDGKLLYQFLLAQPELRHSGVITVSLRLWARRIGWDAETLLGALKHAREARYVVVDDDTEELLVRTLIRNDEVWKQPKMLALAIADAARVESAVLRAEVVTELRRLDPAELPAKTRSAVAAMLAHLPGRLTRTVPQGPADPPPQGHHDGDSGIAHPPADPHADGGANAHAEGARGKGKGNGGSVREPLTPNPEPPPPAGWAQAPMVPFGLPALRAGEGGQSQEQPPEPELGALVAELRQLRPDWSEASIRKALADPRTHDRPWPLIIAAARALAADPETHHPGRLPNDGPWWRGNHLRVVEDRRHPWCGECDERTRFLLNEDGYPGTTRCQSCGTKPDRRQAS